MKHLIILLIGLSITFLGCTYCISEYTYSPPMDRTDGLEVAALWHVNMDTALISEGIKDIKCGRFGEVHSILIYKNNKLVLEEYFDGHKYKWDGPGYHGNIVSWNADSLHTIMSCTKSVTSALAGIAVKKGYIENVHQSIFEYLPNHQHLKTDEKAQITIEHLLTMTSGLEWDEWGAPHGTSANDIDRIYLECSDDPVACILEEPLVHEPGEHFTYHGGGMIVLGKIVEHASGMDLREYSNSYLFEPLGVDSVRWYQFEDGTYATDGSIYVTPRDMLKFGILYLQNGNWEGEQIITSEWVEKSATPYRNNIRINLPIDDAGRNGYSYSWWTNEISTSKGKLKLFQAGGWGGQEIIVFPQENMVVVFTGGNYARKKHIYKMLKSFILPAIE